MSPYARPLYLVMPAIAFLEFISGFVSTTASPIPLPLPLMAADYSPSLISVNRSIPGISGRSVDSLSLVSSWNARDVDPLADLYQYYDSANINANNIKDLAAKSATVDNDDYDFQRDYVSELSGFNSNIQGFQAALVQTTSDKGLANYDRTNVIETLLKNTINLNKDVLSSTDVAVYNLPFLGPTLGPIVYDLKCLIDQILDATEDFSDDTINKLQPLLQALLGKAVSTTCRSGVEIVGLCV